MIRSFKCRETERIFGGHFSPKLPQAIQRAASRKLAMVDAAAGLADLRLPPANRLEVLHGDRAGQHRVRINDQWRICFTWRDGNAYDVETVDYY